jgi:membrane protein DedA with SNARE-associated domain
VAYFIPGVRHLAAVVLGASLLPPTVFARFAYTGPPASLGLAILQEKNGISCPRLSTGR